MPGILDRMACGVALALAIGRRDAAADPPPRQKNGSFLKSARCAKNIANTVKNCPWEGSVWGKGREPKKAKHQEEIGFFSDFLIIFDVAFVFGKNLGTCKKHRKYSEKMRLRTRLELQ